MEFDTAQIMTAGETMVAAASAFVVSYAFSILGAIVLIIAGFVVAGVVERSLAKALGRMRSFDQTLCRFLSKTARYAVLILVGVTVLAQFGVQTASILAALGAAALPSAWHCRARCRM